MTTPDLYPLSLNALLAAANQRSSREPVTNLGEDEVRSALAALEEQSLVAVAQGSRVLRYEHRIRTVLSLRRDETAILCLLLLRGPQTAGELRSRSDRMFPFDDLSAVQSALDRMATREVPLAAPLPRAPGSREVRWTHLLGDPTQDIVLPDAASTPGESDLRMELRLLAERVEALEAALARLRFQQDELAAPDDAHRHTPPERSL